MARVKIVTGKVRLLWPALFTPRGFQGGPPKYSVEVLIPKSDKAMVKKFTDGIRQAISDRWGDQKSPSNVKVWFRDGDQEGRGPAYEGHYFFSASDKQNPPGVIDENRETVLDPHLVKSGDWGRVSITVFTYDKPSPGVSFGLNNVQWLERGEPVGSRAAPEEDFKDAWGVDDDEPAEKNPWD